MSFCALLASAYSLLAPWQPGWPASVLSSTRPMPQRGRKRRRRKTQPLKISPFELPLWEPKAGPSCLISHVSHPRFFFFFLGSEINCKRRKYLCSSFKCCSIPSFLPLGLGILAKHSFWGVVRGVHCAWHFHFHPAIRPQNSRDIELA